MPSTQLVKIPAFPSSAISNPDDSNNGGWTAGAMCFALSVKWDGWYEASVVSSRTQPKTPSGETQFKVHFRGWGAKYDEWLPRDNLANHKIVMATVLKENPQVAKRSRKNSGLIVIVDPSLKVLQKMQQKKRQAPKKQRQKRKAKSGGAASPKRAKANHNSKRNASVSKSSAESDTDDEEETEEEDDNSEEEDSEEEDSDDDDNSENSPEDDDSGDDDNDEEEPLPERLEIKFPNHLRRQLVKDWTCISKQQLVPLPRKLNVKQVTILYIQNKKQKSRGRPHQLGAARDFAAGLELHFNKTLPRLLLYSFERLQYRDSLTRHKGKTPSELYGAEHLLRLFVKLPDLVALAGTPQADMAALGEMANDFLVFLSSQRMRLFIQTYAKPTDEYLVKANIHTDLHAAQLQQIAENNSTELQETHAQSASATVSTVA